MKVELLGYTQLANNDGIRLAEEGKQISLVAIRTCYSPNKPSEILELEGVKYFGQGGSEADRLINMIFKSKHTSTLEHLNFTFAIEGVSRSLLAQLTRHRHMSFSVQSQRYVKFGSDDKSGGYDYILPPSIAKSDVALEAYLEAMENLQAVYDELREYGIPAEDARMVLPNSATCNMVMTCNLRVLIEFYEKRKEGNGAQWEIAKLAELLKDEVVFVESWTKQLFL
jgi:thymidylate synthase (FAD)